MTECYKVVVLFGAADINRLLTVDEADNQMVLFQMGYSS